jgi:hypothetical protein
MAEVGVAYPPDEASAEVIASRLRSAGIASRIDRGLFGAWQVAQRGQITVVVDERQARRAHKVLGTHPPIVEPDQPLLRLAVIVLALVVVFGFFVMMLFAAGYR